MKTGTSSLMDDELNNHSNSDRIKSDFICKDENCPHCLEDRRQIEEDKIQNLAEEARDNLNKTVYCCSGEAEEDAFDIGFTEGYHKAKEDLYTEEQIQDDDLTDDEWLIKEKHKEIAETAIGFAKWLAKDWMSTWVTDKWLWENIDGYKPDSYKHHGEYYTEEELFEIYKAEK